MLEWTREGEEPDDKPQEPPPTLAATWGEVSRRPLSHNSVANILGLLRWMLNVAKRWGHLDQLPEINTFTRPSERQEDDKWLTEDETNRLLEAIEPQWLTLVTVVIRTGLRVGELQELQWGDVDFEGERLTVKREWLERILEFGPPKGGKAREIPLTWDAVAALRQHRGQRKNDAFVFGDAYVPCWGFRRHWGPHPGRARVRRDQARPHPHAPPHVGEPLHREGVPSQVVMLWGGWENEEMLPRCAYVAPREVETPIHRIAPPGAPLSLVKAPPARRRGHPRGTVPSGNRKTAPRDL